MRRRMRRRRTDAWLPGAPQDMADPPTTVRSPHVPSDTSGNNGGPPKPRPKVKRMRLAVLLLGLAILGLVSTVFGMMMAVASDLPQLENKAEFKRAKNSIVTAAPTRKGERGDQLAKLTGNQNRILVPAEDISPNIKNAVIAIEDRRFYEHEGVDYKGIGRALYQDVLRQQRGPGRLHDHPAVRQERAGRAGQPLGLPEAARGRRWPTTSSANGRKQKVLTQYLNSVYFGNGAYGVEAAVRTYFGEDDPAPTDAAAVELGGTGSQVDADDDLDQRAAQDATPAEAALLAGVIASPSLYDPVQNPRDSTERRDAVLNRMLEQEFITEAQYEEAVAEDIPAEQQVDPPQPDSDAALLHELADPAAGGPLQRPGRLQRRPAGHGPRSTPTCRRQPSRRWTAGCAGVGPSASLVAIENRTGEVKAMVGGTDFERRPFNLATNGHRQPGSAFKPFTLVRGAPGRRQPRRHLQPRSRRSSRCPTPGARSSW